MPLRLDARSGDFETRFQAYLDTGREDGERVDAAVAGLFLVVGTIREFSRQAQPVPRQRTAVTIMAGTGDRAVTYYGGPLRPPGVGGWILRRRAARMGTCRPSGGWPRWRRWPGTGPRATGSAALFSSGRLFRSCRSRPGIRR